MKCLGRVALPLIATALLLYSARMKSVSRSEWQQAHTASWAYNISDIDNMGYAQTLLTYGTNKEAPKFVQQPNRGARILIFAYAR